MSQKIEQAYKEWLDSLFQALRLTRNESHKEAFEAGYNAALASHAPSDSVAIVTEEINKSIGPTMSDENFELEDCEEWYRDPFEEDLGKSFNHQTTPVNYSEE